MSDRIDKLKDAIETMHGSQAVHFSSEPVIELFRGEVAWDGVVETFNLAGHPKAKRCHALSYEENVETQFVTVLELPPVDSAETAVKNGNCGTGERNNVEKHERIPTDSRTPKSRRQTWRFTRERCRLHLRIFNGGRWAHR